MCVRGHTGPMCQVCKEGWLFNEIIGHCQCCDHVTDCPSAKADNPAILLGIILGLGVVAAVIVKKSFRKAAKLIVTVFPWITAIRSRISST